MNEVSSDLLFRLRAPGLDLIDVAEIKEEIIEKINGRKNARAMEKRGVSERVEENEKEHVEKISERSEGKSEEVRNN